MAKVQKQIRMEPEVYERLAALATEYGLPLGEALEGLLNTRQFRHVHGEDFEIKFGKLERLAMKNTGTRATWGD